MIKRIVKLTFQTDKTESFIQVFEESKDTILAMRGCQHVEMLRAVSPTNVFFTFSIWDSEECLNEYRNSEFFAHTWSKTKALFSEKAEAWTVV